MGKRVAPWVGGWVANALTQRTRSAYRLFMANVRAAEAPCVACKGTHRAGRLLIRSLTRFLLVHALFAAGGIACTSAVVTGVPGDEDPIPSDPPPDPPPPGSVPDPLDPEVNAYYESFVASQATVVWARHSPGTGEYPSIATAATALADQLPVGGRGVVMIAYDTDGLWSLSGTISLSASRFEGKTLIFQGELGPESTRMDITHTATAGQPIFSWSVPTNVRAPIWPGEIEVYINGTYLEPFDPDLPDGMSYYPDGPNVTGVVELNPAIAATIAAGDQVRLRGKFRGRPCLEATGVFNYGGGNWTGNAGSLVVRDIVAVPTGYRVNWGTPREGGGNTFLTLLPNAGSRIALRRVSVAGFFDNGIQGAPFDSDWVAAGNRLVPGDFVIDECHFADSGANTTVHNVYNNIHTRAFFRNSWSTDPFLAGGNDGGHCFKIKSMNAFVDRSIMASVYSRQHRHHPRNPNHVAGMPRAAPLDTHAHTQRTIVTNSVLSFYCDEAGHDRWIVVEHPRSNSPNIAGNLQPPYNWRDYQIPVLSGETVPIMYPIDATATVGQKVFSYRSVTPASVASDLWVQITVRGAAGPVRLVPNAHYTLTTAGSNGAITLLDTLATWQTPNGEVTIDLALGWQNGWGLTATNDIDLTGDYWTPRFWNGFRASGVAHRYLGADVVGRAVPWLRASLGAGFLPDKPLAGDFHVSLNGVELARADAAPGAAEYRVTGAGTDAGTIVFGFDPAPSDQILVVTDLGNQFVISREQTTSGGYSINRPDWKALGKRFFSGNHYQQWGAGCTSSYYGLIGQTLEPHTTRVGGSLAPAVPWPEQWKQRNSAAAANNIFHNMQSDHLSAPSVGLERFEPTSFAVMFDAGGNAFADRPRDGTVALPPWFETEADWPIGWEEIYD